MSDQINIYHYYYHVIARRNFDLMLFVEPQMEIPVFLCSCLITNDTPGPSLIQLLLVYKVELQEDEGTYLPPSIVVTVTFPSVVVG